MRLLDAFWRAAPWQGSRAVDTQHALLVEETLAKVRAVLILVSLAVSGAEAWRGWTAAAVVLVLLTAYSLVVAFALRHRQVTSNRQMALFHLADTGGIVVAALLTGGALSPFSMLFLFVLLAAGYRWGAVETWLTALAGIAAFGAHAAAVRLHGSVSPDVHLVVLRLTYIGVAGFVIGYMAEAERIARYRSWAVSRILSRVRAEAGLVAAVQSVLDDLVWQFRAGHALLILEEEGNDRVSVWQADRDARNPRRTVVRLKQDTREGLGTYLFPVPPDVEAFEIRRPATGSGPHGATVVALDETGTHRRIDVDVRSLFDAPFGWRAAFCVSTVAGEGWKGRVFLFFDFAPALVRQQLGYLAGLARQVGPALFNLYLQRRLQSRAGVVERARISRELHDGVIQSLIGIEMQLEVLRRESAGRVPETTESQLVHIQHVLSQEILNVRDLMQLLRPAEVDATRLVEHLADMVERFRHRTGIQARLTCDADDIDLSPRACREVAGMVQEALANVRKHSGATSVLVRLGPCGRNWQLVVDDNGRGLDFEGYLTADEADAQRKGPITIRERARLIGGRMALHSQPGFGTRVEVTIPRKHHA